MVIKINTRYILTKEGISRMKGYDAIRAKEQDDSLILCKYADPIEEARKDLSVEEAREIAKEDPGLIWLLRNGRPSH